MAPFVRPRFSLASVLVVGFGGLVLLAVGTVLLLGLSSADRNTQELMSDKADALIDSMVGRLDGQFRPVEDQARWIAERVAAGQVDPADSANFDAFMWGALAATPQTVGIALFRSDGTSRIFNRRLRAVSPVEHSRIAGIDQAVRAARNYAGPTWGNITFSPILKDTVVNLRTPLFRNGKFLGAFVQGVTVSRLSRLLAAGVTDDRQVPFILYDRDKVLAHPLLIGTRIPLTADAPLPNLSALGDPVLSEIWSQKNAQVPFIGPMRSGQIALVRLERTPFIIVSRTMERYGDRPWTVGVYFPAEIETAQIRRLIQSGVAGLVVLLLAVVAAVVLGRKTSRPVRRLATAMTAVGEDRLDGIDPLRRSLLRELDVAAVAFNKMVENLREHRMIRDLFGKYVPESVAAAILRERGSLPPQATVATVLFCDIEGFTSLSERVGPGQVVDVLNDYFSVMVDILEGRGGVVTQFQGDAILATFNVPVGDPDHAAQAVAAAVAMQDAAAARRFGGERLACRIGINTGDVVAGAVGASDRLSYTVHGDAVNVAARLEQLNKDYGTRILLSETTAAEVGGLPLRSIGEITVRGKTAPITVFTVDVGGR